MPLDVEGPDIPVRQAVALCQHTANGVPIAPQDRLTIEQNQPLPGRGQQSALCIERQRQDLVGWQTLRNRQAGHTPLGFPRVEAAAGAHPQDAALVFEQRAHDPIVVDLARHPDLHFDQVRPALSLGEMEKPIPRAAPDRAIARLRERIDPRRALPIIAFDGPEPHGAGDVAGIECKETGIGTDEVTVATGIQEGPDSGRTQAVVAAKRHGGLAIEPYQSFGGAEPDESAPVASNTIQLVPRQAVGGRKGAHRQALRGQRRRGGEGDHARDYRRPEAEECRHCC